MQRIKTYAHNNFDLKLPTWKKRNAWKWFCSSLVVFVCFGGGGVTAFSKCMPTSAHLSASITMFFPWIQCSLCIDDRVCVQVSNGPTYNISILGQGVTPGLHFSFHSYNFGNVFLHRAGMPLHTSTLKLTNKDRKEIRSVWGQSRVTAVAATAVRILCCHGPVILWLVLCPQDCTGERDQPGVFFHLLLYLCCWCEVFRCDCLKAVGSTFVCNCICLWCLEFYSWDWRPFWVLLYGMFPKIEFCKTVYFQGINLCQMYVKNTMEPADKDLVLQSYSSWLFSVWPECLY